MLNLALYAAYATYLSIIAIIGFIAYKHNQRAGGDYILGARSLNYVVTALATHASDMSAWLFMSMPAAIYSKGLIGGWIAIGLTVFMLLNWMFVAPRLRTMTEYHGSTTLSSFFAKRFNDTAGMLRMVSTVCALLFLTCYIAANLAALGHLFESVFSLPYSLGITLGSLVVFYILFGGYTSIAWIDCFQGAFLLGAIIIVPVVAIISLGGWHVVKTAAITKDVFNFFPNTWHSWIQCFFLAVGWGLGYFGQPHIITKFMGIDDAKNIKKAQYVGITWQSITLAAAVLIGLTGIAFFPEGIANTEFIFIEMTKALFHPFLTGLMLCAIVASSINVIGAQVLALASVITEDIVKYVFETRTNHASMIARLSVLGMCVVAATVAYFNQHRAIYDLVFYAWGGLGCSFGPLVLVALHTKLQNIKAAIASVVVGALVGCLWPLFNACVPAVIVGFTLSLGILGLGLRADKKV
ncbi:sodium/proline symporter [Candidatus Dependentiae bacterium]|nr:sodium/proline symporter [Candidatus Dependentiae bacterium]